MQNVKPVLGCAVAFALCATACSVNDHHPIEPMNQSLSATRSHLRTVGDLSFETGPWGSRHFKRALMKYRPLKIVFVAGTNFALVQLGKDGMPDKFVVGIQSNQGKAILQILDAEQPWKWIGLLNGEPEVNGLYFNGNVGGKTWKIVSVYPDAELESLLTRLRRALEPR